MRSILAGTIALLIVVSASAAVNAKMDEKDSGCPMMRQGEKGMGMMNKQHMAKEREPGEGLLEAAEELNLTEEQTRKIRDIQKGLKHAMVDMEDETEALHLKLMKLRNDKDSPLPEIKELIYKLHERKADMQYRKIEALRKANDVLTAEQKKMLDKLSEERRERREQKKKGRN